MNDNYEHMNVEYNDEILEYETDQERDDPARPVNVCVTEPVVTIAGVSQHVSVTTFVLSSDQPFQMILPVDHLRTRAVINSLDQDIVICHSQRQAQDAANLVTTLANANGYVLTSCSLPLETLHIQGMWAVSPVYPARVSVLVERRTA